MTNRPRIGLAGAAALAVAFALSACGGGNDDQPAVTTAVPSNINDSVGNFMGYVRALVASSADNLEPVDVSGVVAKTDDFAEPDAVN